jgi:hypothetical protein
MNWKSGSTDVLLNLSRVAGPEITDPGNTLQVWEDKKLNYELNGD